MLDNVEHCKFLCGKPEQAVKQQSDCLWYETPWSLGDVIVMWLLPTRKSRAHCVAKIVAVYKNSCFHGVSCAWWRHQMETFTALLAFCEGNHGSPVDFPYIGKWRRTLMFSLICAWINDWANNRNAGDLRRHRPIYDVIVMSKWLAVPVHYYYHNLKRDQCQINPDSTIELHLEWSCTGNWTLFKLLIARIWA